MISIFRGDEEFVKVPIEYGSKAKKELMTEDYITIKFSSDNSYKFLVGDYINDPRFGYYVLTSEYLPTINEKAGGFRYEIKFDAYYYYWNNYFFKLSPSESPELSFSLTDTISSHASIILENIKSLGLKYQDKDFIVEIGEDVNTERKVISYDNIHIIDAISLIAETFECEWWVVDNALHFGRCEYGGDYVFKIGDTVSSMTPTESSEETGTRLYVFGSDRNLPQDYRKTSDEKYAIVQKRLMLPQGTPYLEKEGLKKGEVVEFVKIFDIYPKVDCEITSITKEAYIEDDDEGTIKEDRYLFKDKSFKFSKEYLLNEDLTVRFESGSLAGMDFSLKFNPHAKDENTEEGQWLKIVPNENYGLMLPNDTMCPKIGDKYCLLNWDSSKIAELGLVAKAEEELLKEGKSFLESLDTDGKTYTSTMRSDVALKMYKGNIKSLLDVGDSVSLFNEFYFTNGVRKSRILGYEYNLDIPYDNPIYTVGEKPKYTRLKTLEDSIEKVVYSGEVEKNFGPGSVYVISRRDSTLPSDKNVYSSLRAELEFLKKNQEDTAKEMITFEKGLVSKIIAFFEAISSKRYVSGLTGEGFLLEYKDGISSLEIDKLTVRQIMTVFELLIQKIRSVGGQIVVSPANGKIKEVKESFDKYIITFEGENLFVSGDLIRCQTFTGSSKRMYWVEVLSSNDNKITVKQSDFKGVPPLKGDEVVLFGNIADKNRQNLVLISSTEDDDPRIDVLNGINNTISLEGCLKTRLGSLKGIYDKYFGSNQPDGYGLYSDNAYLKGEFILRNSNQNVETIFEIQDGKIKSGIAQTQSEAIREKSYLYNASFIDGLKGWLTSNEESFYFSGDAMLFSGSSLLYQSVSVSSEPIFDNVFFVTINNGWIKQANFYFVNMPTFESGKKYPLSFSAKIRCRKSGLINILIKYVEKNISNSSIGIANLGDIPAGSRLNIIDGVLIKSQVFITTSDVAYGDEILLVRGDNPLLFNLTKKRLVGEVSNSSTETFDTTVRLNTPAISIYNKIVEPNSDFELLTSEEVSWDGVGDFFLSFGGEADIYGLSLYSEKTEVKYRSLFEQSARLIKFSAEKIDEDGNTLNGSEVKVTDTGTLINIVYQDSKNKRKEVTLGEFSLQDNGKTKIKLSGDNILLDGKITANGKVEIIDGKIKAEDAEFINGKFSGEITAESGSIGKLNIDENGLSYEGDGITINNEGIRAINRFGYTNLFTKANKFIVDYSYESSNPTLDLLRFRNDSDYIPALCVETEGGGIAAKMTGAIHLQGGLIQYARQYEYKGAENYVLSGFNSGSFIVLKTQYENCWITLPSYEDLKKTLNNDGDFVTYIDIYNNSGKNIYVKETNKDSYSLIMVTHEYLRVVIHVENTVLDYNYVRIN